MLWQSKPVKVEAVQWTGANVEEIKETFGEIKGLDFLEIGSYIIRNAKGQLEAFSQSAFYEMYERVLEWEENC